MDAEDLIKRFCHYQHVLGSRKANPITCDGYYILRHYPSKRIYVGSTNDLDSRIRHHLADLARGKHFVGELQALYNDSPIVEAFIARTENREEAFEAEQKLVTFWKDSGLLLNKGTADVKRAWVGLKHTPETLEKMAATKRGKTISEETRQRLVMAQARLRADPVFQEKLAAGRIKAAEKMRGRVLSEKEIQDRVQRQRDKPHAGKPIIVDGVRYPSGNRAAKALGLDPEVFRYRLRTGIIDKSRWSYAE